MAKRYAYYPGCSLSSTAQEYDISTRAVFARLGLELHELEDWNCCGATHSAIYKGDARFMLSLRNLALAEAQGFDTIIAPCSACYKNLRRAAKLADADKALCARINAEMKEPYSGAGHVTVLHPLYAIIRDYGLDTLKKQVVRPLTGIKIASYYGCMLTRPADEFDSAERPTGLDRLVKALGAEPVDYADKAKCCGGALALSHTRSTVRLTGKILASAKRRGAEAVMLACPMCHMALDMYQDKAARAIGQSLNLPVLFFTQWMGLALGIEPEQLGLARHMVPTAGIVARVRAMKM
ncbi:MAG TPA: CoB--CoM heterodisulfide reductase iron-sulfur subunit B family protein [Anaerolineae bacterium]|nr:CoB--CoM heterodisulfide reductase iron-sulfur subunit B family protein [Anaerolineae bacterium]HQH39311.1 CoB--CoM heterodisulfide reductase iron-sulfur subunit B family protein [Anaerolineae bacterium]